jgi:Fe-S cluster assembly iron-binding protein IscA
MAEKQLGGSMVSLTESAVKKFKEVVEKQGSAGDGVRIFAVPGG